MVDQINSVAGFLPLYQLIHGRLSSGQLALVVNLLLAYGRLAHDQLGTGLCSFGEAVSIAPSGA